MTMRFGGESMIVGPRGRVYASLENEPDMKMDARKAAEALKPAGKEAAAIAVPATNSDDNKTDNKTDNKAENKAEVPAPASATPVAPAQDAQAAAAPSAATVAVIAGKKPEVAKDSQTVAEGYCVARIDLDEVRRYREEYQTLQARQPTIYKAVVRRY